MGNMQDTVDSIHTTAKNKRKNERKKGGKKEGRIKGRKKERDRKEQRHRDIGENAQIVISYEEGQAVSSCYFC
jgi:hypothetical protein